MVDQSKIKVSKNGPYLVSGKIPLIRKTILTDVEGTPIEWSTDYIYHSGENYALCRCGRSKNKPFCDSSHSQIKFDGTETAGQTKYLEKAEKIDGPVLELTDEQDLCASARFCHRAGGIWNLIPKSDNIEAKKIAVEETGDCPSGRLMIWDKETRIAIEPKFEKSIVLVEDPSIGVSGPIWMRGCIPVESCGGEIYEIRNRVTLCRCGKSSNKPFCDSSHYPE